MVGIFSQLLYVNYFELLYKNNKKKNIKIITNSTQSFVVNCTITKNKWLNVEIKR